MRPGLDIAAFVLLLLLVNVPAPFLGLRFDDDSSAPSAPPGWLVVAAWLVLFPAMGYSHWVLDVSGDQGGQLAPWVIALAVLCATYAYYTLGLEKLTGVSALWFGLVGNLVVIATAATLATLAAPISTTAAVGLSAVGLWTAFATVSVIEELLHRRPRTA